MSQLIQSTIDRMHGAYCRETGHHIPCSMDRRLQWEYLIVAMDNMDCAPERAVVLVAERLKRLAMEFPPWRQKMTFSKFVDGSFFTEHLAAELAERRKPKVAPGYKEVCQATGRDPKPPTPEPKHVETIMQEHQKMAELLKQWKESNL